MLSGSLSLSALIFKRRELVIGICLTVILIAGCGIKDRKLRFVQTEYGITERSGLLCELGMLLNGNGRNILDKSGLPIACSGYVYLSRKEREEML